MRRAREIRFELQTNQNLSRRNLGKAYENWDIGEPSIENPKPVIGPLICGIKRILRKCMWWFVEPYWEQQREYNQAIANMAQDYDRMHSLMMEENDSLRGTIEQLRMQVAELNERLEIKSVFETDEKKGRVIQLVSSLNFGDAVGNDALAIKRMLEEAGYVTAIFAQAIHPRIKEKNVFLTEMLPELNEKDIIIYHYAAADELQPILEETSAKVVLRYHNVTPSNFFHGYDDITEKITKEGLAQVQSMQGVIDYGLAVSEFNKHDLLKMGYDCPIAVAPILIPFDDYKQEPSQDVMEKYSDGVTNIVFVGRIVPNKKFEDVIACFAAYKEKYDPTARLFLVGNYKETDKYYQYLLHYIEEHGVKDVIFPGHIPFDEILAYYRIAHVFLCMSEHEGFCVPLVEAMFFETPIVAYASTAVPGTLGGSGVLVKTKEPEAVAEIMEQIVKDEEYRKEILKKQAERLQDFAYEKIKEQILDDLKVFLQ